MKVKFIYYSIICLLIVLLPMKMVDNISKYVNNRALKLRIHNTALYNINCAVSLNYSNPIIALNKSLIMAETDSSFSISGLVREKTVQNPDVENALITASNLIQRDPLININLGLYYSLAGRYSESISCFEKAYSNVSLKSTSMLCAGITHCKYGRQEYSLKDFSAAVAANPSVLFSHFFRDLAETDSVFASMIVDAAVSLLLKDSCNQLNLSKLGIILFYQHKYDDSKENLTVATEALPQLNRPWLYLGVISFHNHDTISALRFWDKAYLLDETDCLPLYCKSFIDEQIRQFADYVQESSVDASSVLYYQRYKTKIRKEKYLIRGLDEYFEPQVETLLR